MAQEKKKKKETTAKDVPLGTGFIEQTRALFLGRNKFLQDKEEEATGEKKGKKKK